MRRDEAAYLLDMLLAAKDALEFLSGLTFQQFNKDPTCTESRDGLFRKGSKQGDKPRRSGCSGSRHPGGRARRGT